MRYLKTLILSFSISLFAHQLHASESGLLSSNGWKSVSEEGVKSSDVYELVKAYDFEFTYDEQGDRFFSKVKSFLKKSKEEGVNSEDISRYIIKSISLHQGSDVSEWTLEEGNYIVFESFKQAIKNSISGEKLSEDKKDLLFLLTAFDICSFQTDIDVMCTTGYETEVERVLREFLMSEEDIEGGKDFWESYDWSSIKEEDISKRNREYDQKYDAYIEIPEKIQNDLIGADTKEEAENAFQEILEIYSENEFIHSDRDIVIWREHLQQIAIAKAITKEKGGSVKGLQEYFDSISVGEDDIGVSDKKKEFMQEVLTSDVKAPKQYMAVE